MGFRCLFWDLWVGWLVGVEEGWNTRLWVGEFGVEEFLVFRNECFILWRLCEGVDWIWIGLHVLAHIRDGCLRPFCGDGLDERGVVMSYSS